MYMVCVLFNVTQGMPVDVAAVFPNLPYAEEFAAKQELGKKYHAYLLPRLDVDYFSLREKDLEGTACVQLCGISDNRQSRIARLTLQYARQSTPQS